MNNEFLGDRRRALEEEYFAKVNRALLERLRAAEAANAEAGEIEARDADERRGVDDEGASSVSPRKRTSSRPVTNEAADVPWLRHASRKARHGGWSQRDGADRQWGASGGNLSVMETAMVDGSRTVRNWLDDRAAKDGGTRDATALGLSGLRVTVRPLRADDLASYREFVERIDLRDLRLRFGRDVDAVQRAALGRLVEARDDVTLVATVGSDGSGFEIAGDARARIDPHPYGDSAEFGIVVRSDLQRLGLGRALLARLIAECRARGVALLYGLVAPCNDGMLALARMLGFDIEHVPGGTTVVVSRALGTRARAERIEANARRTTPLVQTGRTHRR